MDSLLLVCALAPMAALCAWWLPFFGNKELKDKLEAVTGERDQLLKEKERFDKRLEEKDKKLEKSTGRLEELQRELEVEKGRARQYKDDARKGRSLEGEVQAVQDKLTRQLQEREGLLKELQEELAGQKRRHAEQASELQRAREQISELTGQLARAQELAARAAAVPVAAPVAEAPAVPVAVGNPEEEERLRTELRRLRNTVRDLRQKEALGERELKVLKRKLEHNRRAYVVTSLQLDLAQDELCLLKTGKPRRQTALSRAQVPPRPGECEELEAEGEQPEVDEPADSVDADMAGPETAEPAPPAADEMAIAESVAENKPSPLPD